MVRTSLFSIFFVSCKGRFFNNVFILIRWYWIHCLCELFRGGIYLWREWYIVRSLDGARACTEEYRKNESP
jgi:hypothetical protein